MANDLVLQVPAAVERVDQVAVFILCDRVDGDVPAFQVLFQGNLFRGVEGKPRVTRPGLAFGARQGVFLPGFRVDKNGEIPADRLVSQGGHLFRSGADDNPVAVLYLKLQEFIPYRAADQVNLHQS